MPKNLPVLFTNAFFTLALSIKRKKTYIYIQFKTPQITTDSHFNTQYFLEQSLPSIFLSTCYNDRNLPFRREVENTELGHLYEHVLLEYIALLHFTNGGGGRDFIGSTSWDWRKNERGSFQIEINVGKTHEQILIEALSLTNNLMESFLEPLTASIPSFPHTLQLELPEKPTEAN